MEVQLLSAMGMLWPNQFIAVLEGSALQIMMRMVPVVLYMLSQVSSTRLGSILHNWLLGEPIDGVSHWKRPSEWTPLALKKILLEAIYGSFAEVTSQMYQVESVESWRSTLQKKELWVIFTIRRTITHFDYY